MKALCKGWEFAGAASLRRGPGNAVVAWAFDIATTRISGSTELNHLLGAPADASLDITTLRNCVQQSEQARIEALVTDVMRRGERVFATVARLRRLDGAFIRVLLRGELQTGQQGELRGLTGIAVDMDGPQVAVQEYERHDEISVAVFDFDHLSQSLRRSPALSELYGYPADHWLTVQEAEARYHPDDAEALRAGLDQAAKDPMQRYFDVHIRLLLPGGRVRWINGRGEYVRDQAGRALRSRGVAMDVTAQHEHERNRELLVHELDHRVKNLLAVVEAIARQTYRGDVGIADAREAHIGRLQALRRAHDRIFADQWQTAPIHEVVDVALAPHLASAGRWTIAGPDVFLSSKQALGLTLALHEMATNAVKYGALSNATGRVTLDWRMGEQTRAFELTWKEYGGPPVSTPVRRGFGTKLVESALAEDFAGCVEIAYAPEGVTMTLSAPAAMLAVG